ncbi:MAG TPA: hypothetical protein DEV93_05860 [Chloroflexi bacterium]|nr:hypothetical protein [Chloroflexota bacterium]
MLQFAVSERFVGRPPQITDVKVVVFPAVSSTTEADTLKHPVVGYGAATGPVRLLAELPQRKVTV